jgi:hypothetical protein
MSVQVRQSVQIADGLVGQYSDVMRRFMTAWKTDNDAEMSVLRAEVERIYGGIWEHLDDAAAKTRAAGRSTDAYTAVRSSRALDAGAAIANVNEKFVGFEAGISKTKAKFELTVQHNAEGIEHAKHAIAALQSVWPELDWKPVVEPEVDLRPKGLLSRLFRR